MNFPKIQILAVVGLFLLFSSSSIAVGQVKIQASSTKSNGATLFALEDVKPGLKGVARTVFSGNEPQEFGIEILGVLNGFTGPRQSTIIAKLSGQNVDRTGVFAGMSGSPVFIDNKLVGAIAYSFPFSKEPICGITPIKEMIDIFASSPEKSNPPKQVRAVSFSKLASAEWKPVLPRQAVTPTNLVASVAAGSPLIPLMGQQIQPIATPVVFTGISEQSLSFFSDALTKNGLLPVSGVGGAASITPLA